MNDDDLNVFSFVNEITLGKNRDLLNDATETLYVPFVINRALSYHSDCIFFANRMNQLSHLPKRMQYDYYIYSIRSRKRYSTKWGKPDKDFDYRVKLVQTVYNYSKSRAQEVVNKKLLTDIDFSDLEKYVQIIEGVSDDVNQG